MNPNTLATNIPGVFAGGDFTAGPTYVIMGIAAGRRGAVAISKYLRGDRSRVDLYDLKGSIPADEKKVGDLKEDFEEKPRTRPPMVDARARTGSFVEIEQGFPEQIAREEATRCLRCDLEK